MSKFSSTASMPFLLALSFASVPDARWAHYVWPACVEVSSRGAPSRMPRPSAPMQLITESVDLSSTYKGRVYYGDQSGDRYIMKGKATLEIKGHEVTLTARDGQSLKGSIKAARIPSKDNFPIGEIQFQSDSPIEIRWYKVGNTLKLVRAKNEKNATRVFRFCSDALTMAQCRDRI